MIKPDKIMLIDSSHFNGNQQHPYWYDSYNTEGVHGFPNDLQIRHFLTGLGTVITCETFYNNSLTMIARDMGVRTICIANPEFFDWFKPNFAFIPLPDKVVAPSYWMLQEMKQRFNATYLPTPIFDDEFKDVREQNLQREGKPRYLFVNGKSAAHDRAGLESLYEALHLSKGDFEVVVKSQGDIKRHPDPRLVYDDTNPEEPAELYRGFDAMIHPRRYGGQSMPMTEALMAGLPVIMTDIEPNNSTLPDDWLVPAQKTGEFMARTSVDVYSADPKQLALVLDTQWIWSSEKNHAIRLGKQYEAETLRPQYEELVKT